ncbi:unnamed protein product [Orchesella dallaii]|uniref:DAGKc domain-containing protein n=1 Tax=Orchesella dallaii TaxID=48710 RepID=A0ABP1QK63_9HEXA
MKRVVCCYFNVKTTYFIFSGTEDMSEWMKVRIQDILAVELLCKNNNVGNESKAIRNFCCLPNRKPKAASGSESSGFGQYLTIHFSQRVKDSSLWTRSQIQLSHSDYPVLHHWHQTLLTALNGMLHRPKSLLFFVNPYGGKRKGVTIFEKQVKPLLQLCSCKWTVINTQRRNHATEALAVMSDEKIGEFDVVVGVGGDGTICEVVTGLLTRGFPSSKAIDEGDLQSAPIPVAVIPAGSSNALAYTLHGTDDPQTAILHILLGSAAPLDVAAIHNHSGISRFIVGQMSYGHLADTMLYSEKLRWMGPKRYDVAGFRKFLSHATYEGSVDMRVCVDDNRKIPTQCLGGSSCDDCTNSANRTGNGEWKRVEGRFLGISGANISCRCALSPLGMAPFAHLADGHIDLILIRQASRLKHLQYLLRTAGDSRRAFALPFVERYKVDEFIFTPLQCCQSNGDAPARHSSKLDDCANNSPDRDSDLSFPVCGCDSREKTKAHSVWNCDGELWYQPSVRVTVHKNLIRIMTRSTEAESHLPSSSSSSLANSAQSSPPLSPNGSDSTVPMTLTPTPIDEISPNDIFMRESSANNGGVRY